MHKTGPKPQCWSESGLVSPAVSPSPQGQSPSPSPSPSRQSPSPSGVSPSPLDQSPSPSPSPVGPSPSPRVQQKSEWVRTQPGLMSPTIENFYILTLFLKALMPITFSSPRAQPEVVHFLISNESPSIFLVTNPKF